MAASPEARQHIGSSHEGATIRNLLPATVYTMRLIALNNIDRSSFTEAVVMRTQDEEPSQSPIEVRVDSAKSTELLLSWSVPPRDSWHGDLLGYVITWLEDGMPSNSSTRSLTVQGWATTKTHLTGLKKFTRYQISIRAFNSVSTGPPSTAIIGTTKEGVPEAAPQNVECSQISSQSMKVSWSPPPLDLHGGLILGYKVSYRPIDPENVDALTTAEVKRTSSFETYLHGLSKFTEYSIKVLAFTGAGDGVASTPLSCITAEDLPDPPENIKAIAMTAESILVSWLAPKNRNGKISHYTVYAREAGRVGKHTSYTVCPEDLTHVAGLLYEVRSLTEHRLYEFWVSATTSIGEGEPTAIINQATNTRAPAKIASFGRALRRPANTKALLPCIAAGNPTPHTRWIHRDKPITFSAFYRITNEGHLDIHKMDPTLNGNYSCSAKNLFGEDKITYDLTVVIPPSTISLEVQYATSKAIRLQWTPPVDGGAPILGYTLNIKHNTDDWKSIELSPDQLAHKLDDLRCGSVYHIYIVAHNRVGNGSPSPIQAVHTKGGPPLMPQEKDLIAANATSAQLNLYQWPDGGCPIEQYAIEYRLLGQTHWMLVSTSILEDKIVIHGLTPATWYQIKIVAENDAGKATGQFNYATTTINGEKIPLPPKLDNEETPEVEQFNMKEIYIYYSVGIVFIFVIIVIGTRIFGKDSDEETEQEVPEIEAQDYKREEREERENFRRHQVYRSSPKKRGAGKSGENVTDLIGMHEISPYATFSVPAANASRALTTSMLDYTVQFKTFGHIDDDNAIIYPKPIITKHKWQTQCHYKEDPTKGRPHRRSVLDSESDDTSGGEFSNSVEYRVPVKPGRNDRLASYSGRDTLPVPNLFRRESSTESNDMSPPPERRPIPQIVIGQRRFQRPTTSSR